jgi:hypothetical protein
MAHALAAGVSLELFTEGYFSEPRSECFWSARPFMYQFS